MAGHWDARWVLFLKLLYHFHTATLFQSWFEEIEACFHLIGLGNRPEVQVLGKGHHLLCLILKNLKQILFLLLFFLFLFNTINLHSRHDGRVDNLKYPQLIQVLLNFGVEVFHGVVDLLDDTSFVPVQGILAAQARQNEATGLFRGHFLIEGELQIDSLLIVLSLFLYVEEAKGVDRHLRHF